MERGVAGSAILGVVCNADRARHRRAVGTRAVICDAQLALRVEVPRARVAVVVVIYVARRTRLCLPIVARARVHAADAVALVVGLHVVACCTRVSGADLSAVIVASSSRDRSAIRTNTDVLLA